MAGTGLSGQLSTAVEGTYGTYVAPDRSFEILSESLDRNQVILQPQGLRAGTPNLRTGSKRSLVTHAAAGDVSMEVASKGFGRWLQQMLGSSTSLNTVLVAGANRQVHTLGDNFGMFQSIQKGVPTAAGTVLPFTVLGAKIVDWELKINTSDYAQLKCGIDGRQMSTSQSLVSLGSAPN